MNLTLDTREHSVVPTWFEPACGTLFMSWRPATQYDALMIHDLGGPLIDHDTGQVLITAELVPEHWAKLAGLPADASPYPIHTDEPRPARERSPAPVAGAEHEAFAMALAAA